MLIFFSKYVIIRPEQSVEVLPILCIVYGSESDIDDIFWSNSYIGKQIGARLLVIS